MVLNTAMCNVRFGDINATTLDRVYQVLRQDWFYGDISRKDSNNLLRNNSKNLFLVRCSTTEPIEATPFSISRVRFYIT